MRFLIRTYGCQMNERDSEAVGALLEARGHVAAASEADAEVIIVNTCSVRRKAEEKALGKLGLLASARGQTHRRLVGAMGCMVQRLKHRLFEKVPNLDFGVGTHALALLPDVIAAAASGRPRVLEVSERDPAGTPAPAELAGHAGGGPTAFVNILLGCDRHCAYCIVPAVRGTEWSRPAADVVEEVRRLAAHGVRDVTLLGQSVMSYGRANAVWPADHRSPRRYAEPLPRLLEALAGVPGIERLRFTSGHPSGCTSELAHAMAELPQVCEHLHLPVQSGSDRILRRMRRGYTAAGYVRAVNRLRSRVPGLALTTDVIVGFPSETEADFEATRTLMEQIGFDNAFIFKYSPRAGTPAADMKDDVPAPEKLRRNKVLLADQERRALRINGATVGMCVEALAEGPSPRNADRWFGRTRTNKIVVFAPCKGVGPGDRATVRVERATAQALYGSIASQTIGPTEEP